MLPPRLWVLATLVVLLATACGSTKQAGGVPADSVALVGGQKVLKSRVDNLMNQAKVNFGSQARDFPKPGSVAYESLRERAIGFLVVGAMYEDKAAKEGIVVSDADVKAALDKIRQTVYGGSEKKQEAAMKAQGLTPFEQQEEERLKLVEQRIQQKLVGTVKVTAADLQAYYSAHVNDYTTPASRLIRQILVHSMSLAKELAAELKHGADFASLARQYSEDSASASSGGKLTVQQEQTSDPHFSAVAFSLRQGEVSAPFRSPDGAIRIVTPIGPIRPPQKTPLSQVANAIRPIVLQQKQQSVLAKWQLDAKKEYCGKKILYAPGAKPSADIDPCGQNSTVPTG